MSDKSDGIHLFQCKRVQRFGPAQMKAAAEAAAATTAEKRVLVLSRVASPAARSTAERVVGWDIWDHDDIVRMLQQKVRPESARTSSRGVLSRVEGGFPRLPRWGPVGAPG